MKLKKERWQQSLDVNNLQLFVEYSFPKSVEDIYFLSFFRFRKEHISAFELPIGLPIELPGFTQGWDRLSEDCLLVFWLVFQWDSTSAKFFKFSLKRWQCLTIREKHCYRMRLQSFPFFPGISLVLLKEQQCASCLCNFSPNLLKNLWEWKIESLLKLTVLHTTLTFQPPLA